MEIRTDKHQTEHYKNYIEADPDWEFVGVFADKKSGTDSDRREGFQRMIDLACEGKIDTILTKSISRFSRNLVNTLHYIEVLNSHGVNVIFYSKRPNQKDIDTKGIIW